jgi:Arc/MetJ family transcription regulator
MKATIAIDDELFAAAQECAGDKETSAVISEALKAFCCTRGRAPIGAHGRFVAGFGSAATAAI